MRQSDVAISFRDRIIPIVLVKEKAMFTVKDLRKMDYFGVLCATSKKYELNSLNTGHYWRLVLEGGAYTMYHKHHEEDEYHFQTILGNLYDCILYIVSHDEYQMQGRKVITVSEEKRRGSLFWKLIDKYGTST